MKDTSVRVGPNTGCIQLPEGLSLPLAWRHSWQVPRAGWESTEELPCRYTQLWEKPTPLWCPEATPTPMKGEVVCLKRNTTIP